MGSEWNELNQRLKPTGFGEQLKAWSVSLKANTYMPWRIEVDVGWVEVLISGIGDDKGTGSRADLKWERIGNDGGDGC